MQTIRHRGRHAFDAISARLFEGGIGISPRSDILYVDAHSGHDNNAGKSWSTAKATIGSALGIVQSGGVIAIRGRFTEQATTPTSVTDVTIVGVNTRPRAGHTDVGPKRGAANWRPAAAPTGANFTVTCQGWRVVNIMFSGHAEHAMISLQRDAGAGTAEKNAGHFSAFECAFWGGLGAIWDTGGANNVHLYDCDFRNMTGATAFAIKTVTTAIAVPLWWVVENCRFQNNKNHVSLDSSEGLFKGCVFTAIGHGITTVTKLDTKGPLGQGANNVVTECFCGGDYRTNNNEYQGGSGDEWVGNYLRLVDGSAKDSGVWNLVPST